MPDDAAQWIALAILHSDDEEYPAAFVCYEQAERLDPESAALRLNWGVSAVRAGRLRLARAQLKHLQQLEPRSTRPWLLRAFILEEEDRIPAARLIYERVLGRGQFTDQGELNYALEMAMDFFARHHMRPRCERLLTRAYAENACTVELCEAYREVTGERVEKAYWFSVLVEADYRPGLSEVCERGGEPPRASRASCGLFRSWPAITTRASARSWISPAAWASPTPTSARSSAKNRSKTPTRASMRSRPRASSSPPTNRSGPRPRGRSVMAGLRAGRPIRAATFALRDGAA